MSEVFTAMRRDRQAERAGRRASAGDGYELAAKLAECHRMEMIKCGSAHYQLRVHLSSGRMWLYNLYPGNGRICQDPFHKGPFLCTARPWSLDGVVRAAMGARKSRDQQMGQVNGETGNGH
ncbi:MAG TPA: hypothetical protein VLM89_16170, partial [Phycisphaerae bacterium]|nr:hypothetical protein [Phycisphaerae bacterium]